MAGVTLEPGPCVNLLGGPYLTVAGQRVEVPEGGKRLLAFVALNGGRVERRRAAGMLWPENDDLRAAGNLRSALWRLRGPGCEVLEADKAALWLRAGTSVDVDVMHDWAERLIAGSPAAADLCPVLWRADFVELLPGWYDDWALFERERIRQVLLHALEALTGHLVEQRRWAEAVTVATTTVAVEPLRESAQRVLITAHLAEGNLIEARRAYEAYNTLVRRELGVPPGRPVRELTAAWSETPGPAGTGGEAERPAAGAR
jgi:DNA-binding SARP family transcriptional activator